MANWWFSVIVLASIQQVFGAERDCVNLDTIQTCDECIRCGGFWCKIPIRGVQCLSEHNNQCSWNKETPRVLFRDDTIDGTELQPRYLERTLVVGSQRPIELTYHQKTMSTQPQVNISIFNSTIENLSIDHLYTQKEFRKNCANGKCTVDIIIMPRTTFCPADGTDEEKFTLRVEVEGVAEEFKGNMHVACACACSKNVERDAQKCNGRGDYACGSCSCRDGWEGRYCEQKMQKAVPCERKAVEVNCDRGDTPEQECMASTGICSNNGHCSCGKCECCTNTGVEYFGDFCEDICLYTSNCETCIRNGSLGRCEYECSSPIFIEKSNKTLLSQQTWTSCNLTEDGCVLKYEARKGDDGEVRVMVISSCNGIADVLLAAPVNVTIPVILGLIAMVAAVAAVAGYVMWKNRAPPHVLNSPGYKNITGQDCTGMNPLYKPPTSSFKNPMYNGNK